MTNLVRIGTFNIQGGNVKIKKISMADDMEEYNITALATTLTKISAQNNITQTLKTSNGKVSYVHYLSGSKKHQTRCWNSC